MKFLFSLAVATAALLFAAGAASAKSAIIALPPGVTPFIKPGHDFTFRLKRPDLPKGQWTELGLAISLRTCSSGDRCSPRNRVTSFNSPPFNPKVIYHDGAQTGLYQDITIAIPKDAALGDARLRVLRSTKDPAGTDTVITESLGFNLKVTR